MAATAPARSRSGLPTNSFVILPGQEDAFRALQASLTQQFRPDGAYQELLFKEILHSAWTLERCRKAEAQLHAEANAPNLDPLLVEANAAKLRMIALYAGRAQRSFYRAIKELRTVQTEICHRIEEDIDADGLSPLVDTQAIQKQAATNRAKLQNAALQEIRAFCEAPTPGQFDKLAADGQTKPMSLEDMLVSKLCPR
ncbi:MAG: hypothetical protein JNK87_10920 [Bryobacterales bacterium]|nr:hypothetical protein [Bryobacterales bacterium]